MNTKRLIIYASAITAFTGGSYTILSDLIKGTKELQGIKVTLLGSSTFSDVCSAHDIELVPIEHNLKWMRRFCWEFIFSIKFLKKFENDEVVFISLQNSLPRLPRKFKSIIYLHQPLPYDENIRIPFKYFRSWLKQKIYPFFVEVNLKETSKVIVQTEWMRRGAARIHKINHINILIHRPKIEIAGGTIVEWTGPKDSGIVLFYPAKFYFHKNHFNLIAALNLIMDEAVQNKKIELKLTLSSEEFEILKRKFSPRSKNINLINMGSISREEVFKQLSISSAMIFPSISETFGLPLIEAEAVGSPILVSDLDYAHEVIDGYSDVIFFNPNNVTDIVRAIESFVTNPLVRLNEKKIRELSEISLLEIISKEFN